MAKKANDGGRRVAPSLVALGSAVIAAVYGTGYARTQPAASQVALASASESTASQVAAATATTPGFAIVPTPSPSPSSTATAVPASPTPRTRTSRSAGTTAPVPTSTTVPSPTTARPTATSTSTSTAAASAKYRDGTYVGVGYSRHGGIQATVVIQGGKIVSAAVTGCSTRYPCSVVNPLPPEVVSQQTYQVDYISGATDSSMAYQGAVANALAKAGA